MLAVLVLPAVAFIAWDGIEGRRLARAAERVDLSDEALAGYLQPQTEEQIRASHDYSEAERLSATTFRAPSLEASRIVEQLQALGPGEVTHDPRFARLRELEQAYGRALELLDRATALDAHGFTEEDRPSLLMNRGIASVNALRIARLALSGNGERACAALLATLRLDRVFPPSSSQFRTAQNLELILTRTGPSERALAALQQEYARVESQETVHARLEASRVRLMQMTMPELFGEPPWNTFGVRRVSPMEVMVKRLSRPFRAHALRRELANFERAFAAAAKPWPEKLNAMRGFMDELRSLPQHQRRRSVFRTILNPMPAGYALDTAAAAIATTAEGLARDRASIAALAITRYQRAHGGTAPTTLHDLVPAYLSAPPLDPFTGRELYYTHEASGYKVYSAGANRKDDGGEWYAMTDLNPFRRGNPNDIGIYVQRRVR